jgi:hypothetical protein
VSVQALESDDDARWDEFVYTHSDATLYQTVRWRDFVTEVFRHEARYLIASHHGRVSGVMPLFLIRQPLLGSKLISLPYDVGAGGPLVSDAASEDALIGHALALAKELRVKYLEIRCGRARPALDRAGMRMSEPVLISDMELDGETAVWSRVRKDHIKAMRKADTRGVKVTPATTLDDYLAFYDVYLRVFRDFGTPPYDANYFTCLWRSLHAAGNVKLLLARVDGRCLGGLMFFCAGTNLVSKFAACLPEAVPLRAYAALYGEAIRLGLTLGYRRLSWGTSSHQQKGLVEFKEGWGSTTRTAAMYQSTIRGSAPSIERYYDSRGLAQRAWRHMPLSLTRMVGPALNRWFC